MKEISKFHRHLQRQSAMRKAITASFLAPHSNFTVRFHIYPLCGGSVTYSKDTPYSNILKFNTSISNRFDGWKVFVRTNLDPHIDRDGVSYVKEVGTVKGSKVDCHPGDWPVKIEHPSGDIIDQPAKRYFNLMLGECDTQYEQK